MRKPLPAMGFELLRRQTIEFIEDRFADLYWAQGDSEIERLLHAALACRFSYGPSTYYDPIMLPSDLAEKIRLKEVGNKFFNELQPILERQVQIGRYRVDFVLSAYSDGTVYSELAEPVVGQPRWRRLVIECDGHDFHERTKEQAAKDRSRDRELSALGFDVFRFTGSELWRDPWGCASQVHEWAERGLRK